MKTIEERAKEYSDRNKSIENSYFSGYNYNYNIAEKYDAEKFAYEAGAYDQKAIDDAKLLKLKSAWEKQAQINHDDEANYQQGYHDAIDKACEWLEENARDYACATIRCPYGEEEEIICDVHREIVEDFRKAMEEEK